MTLDMFEPLALAPPKRARFGLADGDRVAEPEMPTGPPQAELAFDPQETLVVCARRRHSPDPPVSTIGEAEILELQELLTERMPALLTQVDLVAKLSTEATQAHEEEPSIADVIAAVEAAREAAAREVGIEAEAEAASQDCAAPFALNVSTVRFRPAPEDRSEKALLAQLHAHLEAEHTAFRAKIAALQMEFGLGQVAA